MSFLDKLFGKKGKGEDENPAPAPVPPEIRAWKDALLRQLDPANIRFQPGETLGDVFARILNQEEQGIRAGSDAPALKELKYAGIAELRRQFGAAAPTAAKESTMSEPSERQAEATYEMLMGGAEDLKDVPIVNLMQLVVGWARVVQFIGKTRGVAEEQMLEFKRVGITVEATEKGQELMARFHGTKEMIEAYRAHLREAGLDAGPA